MRFVPVLLFFPIVFLAINAKTNGTTSTRRILSTNELNSTFPDLPKNSIKYMGNKRTCKIKFTGITEVDKGTFPLATPVNTKYQSVHGVTISITKPIHIGNSLVKKIYPKM